MQLFEAYIDESGNTGIDLFRDSKQPFFWTGTLVVDGAIKYPYDAKELAESIGKTELHGSELGLGRINQLAGKLIEMIEQVDAKFHFTRTEKKHIPTMRFVDAILDNVNNSAVSPLHYQVSIMRKILAAKIENFFDEQDQIDFWDIHLSGDATGFKEFLRRFRKKISYKYPSSDRRGKYIILDALEWGIRHPEELLSERVTRPEGVKDYRSLQYESPNLVSMTMFLSGIHNLGDKHNRKVSKIVHDEQSQFGQYLEQSYQNFKNVNIQDRFNLFPVAENTKMFPDKLEFANSSSSPHLQVVDICMWLLKQKIDGKKEIHGAAGELLDNIISRSTIFHFSSEFLRAEANYFVNKVMSMPLTEKDLVRGKTEVLDLKLRRNTRLENNW